MAGATVWYRRGKGMSLRFRWPRPVSTSHGDVSPKRHRRCGTDAEAQTLRHSADGTDAKRRKRRSPP